MDASNVGSEEKYAVVCAKMFLLKISCNSEVGVGVTVAMGCWYESGRGIQSDLNSWRFKVVNLVAEKWIMKQQP